MFVFIVKFMIAHAVVMLIRKIKMSMMEYKYMRGKCPIIN